MRPAERRHDARRRRRGGCRDKPPDPFHGRFCQRDPPALADTDVCSIARRALAIDELQRILIERVRQGLTDGPWTTLNPLLIATLDAKQLYLRFAGVPLAGHALGLRTAHLDSLNLYQYGRSNPQFYLDPDGRFSLVELGISSGISGLLGALFGGVSSAISGGSFWWEWLAPYADASDAREESDGRIQYNSIRRSSLIWDCPAYERRTTAPLWNPPHQDVHELLRIGFGVLHRNMSPHRYISSCQNYRTTT